MSKRLVGGIKGCKYKTSLDADNIGSTVSLPGRLQRENVFMACFASFSFLCFQQHFREIKNDFFFLRTRIGSNYSVENYLSKQLMRLLVSVAT